MGHFPSGSSLKSIIHYGQVLADKAFQKFDYGEILNMQIYGQITPPVIPIEKITDVPVALFVGKEDELADFEDSEWAQKQLVKSIVSYKEYILGHISFLIAKDMSYFTKDVMEVLHQYHPAQNAFLNALD